MSDELSNATRIAALEDYNQRLLAENVRLSNEAAFMRSFINNENVRSDFPTATAMRETLESLRQSIYAACAGSGCVNAHELRVALDRERERCGVLEAEVKAWHAAEHLRKDEPHNEFMRLAEARARTRETHALDAAKFGKEQK